MEKGRKKEPMRDDLPFPPVKSHLCKLLCLNPCTCLVRYCSFPSTPRELCSFPSFCMGGLGKCHLSNFHRNTYKLNQSFLLPEREETLQTPILPKSSISAHLRAIWIILGRNHMCFISFVHWIQLHAAVNTSILLLQLLLTYWLKPNSDLTPAPHLNDCIYFRFIERYGIYWTHIDIGEQLRAHNQSCWSK